jgi:hypothetical protein
MARRFPRFRAACLLLAIGFLQGALAVSAGPGYLPAVGPVPVRFQAVNLAAPPFLWPPLVPSEPPAAKAEVPATNAPAAAVVPQAEWVTNAPPAPVVITSAPPPPAPAPVSPFPLALPSQPEAMADGGLEAQASIHYLLTVSTNTSGTKIIMPGFVPPPPPAFRASQATYESR